MLKEIALNIEKRFGGIQNMHIQVAHSNCLEEGQAFLEEIKKLFPGAKDYYCDSLSLSVSCHIGPGSLAIAMTKDLEIDE